MVDGGGCLTVEVVLSLRKRWIRDDTRVRIPSRTTTVYHQRVIYVKHDNLLTRLLTYLPSLGTWGTRDPRDPCPPRTTLDSRLSREYRVHQEWTSGAPNSVVVLSPTGRGTSVTHGSGQEECRRGGGEEPVSKKVTTGDE